MHRLIPFRISLGLVLCLLSTQLFADVVKLNLSQALALALTQNKLLAAEQAGLDAAGAGVTQAQAHFWPKVTASSGVVRTDSALNVFGFKMLQQNVSSTDFNPDALNDPALTNNIQNRIDIQASVYQGGATQAAKRRAEQSFEAAKMSMAARKQKLLFDVIAAYNRVFQSEAQVTAAQKAYEAAQKHLKTTESLQRKGVVINSDVMDTNVHRLNARITLNQAKNAYQRSLDELRRLLNIKAATELRLEQPPTLSELPQDAAALADWAANNRPDIVAMQHQNKAAKAAIDERSAAFKPQLSVQLSQEWNSENFDLENQNKTLAAKLSWNIFAGGGDKAAISAARAQALKHQYQIDDKRYAIRNEVLHRARLLNEAVQRQHVKQQALEQATEALRIRSLRHQQGLEKTSDLLASQAQLDASRADAIRATYDVNIVRAALLLAAGKLTQEDIK